MWRSVLPDAGRPEIPDMCEEGQVQDGLWGGAGRDHEGEAMGVQRRGEPGEGAPGQALQGAIVQGGCKEKEASSSRSSSRSQCEKKRVPSF